ncbi:MAG: DNA polymerase III subunit beta [Candidatus Adiutrix sp.]|jgi:DNA polymerase-3 subunit beta|nr:DNA polymerase III subunit beta [Candidatus Adiutrix sp.]
MLALKIKKDELARGVGQTSAIADKRSALPLLSNILLEADEGRLRLTATDMEISFQGTYPAEVVTPGRLTVPARTFNDLVRNMPAEEVKLAEDANFVLLLSAGRYNDTILGASPDDFPAMPPVDDIPFLDLAGRDLQGVIDRTIYSVAKDETRYNLSGIYMEKVEYEGRPNLRLVSTDGHRLNLAGLYTPDLAKLELPKGVLAPSKGLGELRKLTEGAETVRLGFSGESLVARSQNAVLVMRLQDGRFPDYNLVLPKDNHRHLLADRRELLEALKHVEIMCAGGEYKVVKLALTAGRLVISTVNPNRGQAEAALEAEYEGEPLEIGLNPRYCLEALGPLDSEKVRLSFLEASNPVLLTAAEDPGYSGVIMSMKI